MLRTHHVLAAGLIVGTYFVAGPAQANNWPKDHTRDIFVTNSCDNTRKIYVNYSPRKDVWVVRGTWTFAPGESANLTRKGKRLRHRDNAHLYVKITNRDGSRSYKSKYGKKLRKKYRGRNHTLYEAQRAFRGNRIVVDICKEYSAR